MSKQPIAAFGENPLPKPIDRSVEILTETMRKQPAKEEKTRKISRYGLVRRNVLLGDEEWNVLMEAANREGRSCSDVLRRVIRIYFGLHRQNEDRF